MRNGLWVVVAGFGLASLAVASNGASVADGAVHIVNFTFQPFFLTLTYDSANGNHVNVVNDDNVRHLAHFLAGDPHLPQMGAVEVCFKAGPLNPGQSVVATIDAECAELFSKTSGNNLNLRYHCHIHPFMEGEVRLQPA